MNDDEAENVAMGIYDILDDNSGIALEELRRQLGKAPAIVKHYINRYCGGQGFVDFLRDFPDLFYIENNRIAQHDAVPWEEAREEAVEYFRGILENLDDQPLPPPHRFRGHVGQASDNVIDFVNSFYPQDEFRLFLLSEPDVFVILDDGTVSLIEDECLDYFEEKLEVSGSPMHFTHLRGHLGQAPPHVQSFIRAHYSGPKFREFLESSPEVFLVDVNGYAHLCEDVEDESD